MQAITKAQAATRLARKYRLIPAFAAFVLAVGPLALLAAPARAADGPPEVGCTTGSSCMIELNYDVTYTGSRGGHNGIVVTPPPCIGVPFGDAHNGSQAIINFYGATTPVAQPTTASPTSTDTGAASNPTDSAAPTGSVTPSSSTTATASATASATPTASTTSTASTTALVLKNDDEQSILSQAESLVNSNPIAPGEWYQVAGNPNATTAAQAQCGNLPLYIWEAGKGTFKVDGLNIPPETLAALAYGQLSTASLSQVTLNPKSVNVDTNLPTFVDVTLRSPARKVLSVTAAGVPYVWATAATPDGQAATVWAWVTGMSINGGSTNSTPTVTQDCTQAHAGPHNAIEVGSRYSLAQMEAVGVNQPVDCGVTYSAPGTFNLTASVTWNACWAPGVPTTPGPPAAGCQPVPGAQNLQPSTSRPVAVHVREIQSVNNA